GKYFGPTSPCDEVSLSTDLSEAGSEALAKHYLADASASYTHGDEGVVSSSEASLPTDEDTDDELRGSNGGGRRVVRRKHRRHHQHQHSPDTTNTTTTTPPHHTNTQSHNNNTRRNKDSGLPQSCTPRPQPPTLQEYEWASSESSPECHPSTRHHHHQRTLRHHHNTLTTPDTEEVVERRQRLLNMPQNRYSDLALAQSNRNNDVGGVDGDDDDMGRMSQSISSASLADLMDKLRQRAAQRPMSLSRDNSVASNLSEMVTSPLGSRRYPFKREDSVCSNVSGVSDLAPSECCSEASLDVSVKDDLAVSTLTCLDNIEHELDDLKTDMIEMDQEVTKFTSRPDPYTFKTTYSDVSVGSGESRPPSAMEVYSSPRSKLSSQALLRAQMTSDAENADSDSCQQQVSEASGSMEWDSPQHGWSSSSRPRPLSLPTTLPSHTASRCITQVP
ncbi:hypothetical protein Pcinc_029115, partial [Petrolisthes cinctipes]